MSRRRKVLTASPVALMLAALPCAWADDGAAANPSLEQVVVTGQRPARMPANEAVMSYDALAAKRAASSDTAALLADVPGVSLYGNGGVSSLPVIHGLADDRVRTQVDGMDLIAACPNHMNPALSYLDPTNVGQLKVYAGIAPVSVGGDSIGGTIVAETPAPEFAVPGQGSRFAGEVGASYHSNGGATSANVAASYATESFHINYAAANAKASDYKAAEDFKTFTATGRPGQTLGKDVVGSTAYDVRNQTLGLAFKGGNHLVEVKFGHQDVPYQLYPNQRMDMLGNTENRLNLRYLGQFAWGTLDARAYRETVKHHMDFGDDKQFVYGAAPGIVAPGMPMDTKSENTGARLMAAIDLNTQDQLRLGGELQRYTLDDWWPASPSVLPAGFAVGGMAPNTFWNINNGRRDRTALFGEWEKRLNADWMTLLGARYERVTMDTGPVQGYNNALPPSMYYTGYLLSATQFNARDRKRTDGNVDLTALARYTPDANRSFELGYAQKTRSPNLYERYSWSRNAMALIMNNFVGDGNGYLGNVDLKPEVAHTLSFTGDWHSADRAYEFKVTPYYTRVTDYIDAVQWNRTTNLQVTTLATGQFVVLKYMNQSARLYGLDVSGRMPLGRTSLGDWGLKGVLTYTNGKNLDTGDTLYNIVPLTTKLTLTHAYGGWDDALELVASQGKEDVSDVRNEIKTAGYSLVNLRASYSWKKARVDFGVENLFDKAYYLPTGGAYAGQGSTMSIAGIPWGIAVPGPGRSLYTAVNFKF